jgi:predicted negative regulator of RcsB-dependent stress response
MPAVFVAVVYLAPAVRSCREALVILDRLSDRHGSAATWEILGDVHRAAGVADAARDAYRRALDLGTDLNQFGAETVQAKLLGLTQDTAHEEGRR